MGRQKTEKRAQQESPGTARSWPHSAEQDGDVRGALHTHRGPDDFTESRSILLSCLAFSLASAFSSFLAFTIWAQNRVERERENLQHKPQKPSSRRKETNQPLMPGRQGHRTGEVGQIKAHFEEANQAGSHLMNEFLNS